MKHIHVFKWTQLIKFVTNSNRRKQFAEHTGKTSSRKVTYHPEESLICKAFILINGRQHTEDEADQHHHEPATHTVTNHWLSELGFDSCVTDITFTPGKTYCNWPLNNVYFFTVEACQMPFILVFLSINHMFCILQTKHGADLSTNNVNPVCAVHMRML